MTGFFWPIYGDKNEIVFPLWPSRAHWVVRELLRNFKGSCSTGAGLRDRRTPVRCSTG